MKTIYILYVFLVVLVFGCQDNNPTFHIMVENPYDFPRENEAVVIQIEDLNFDSDTFTGAFSLFQNNQKIPFQTDDLDKNGTIDEISFLCNLGSNEKATFLLKYAEKEIPETNSFKQKTWAQLMLKKDMKLRDSLTAAGGDFYQECFHHGPAFENEKISYRIYFDQRMSIDVYGKKQNQFELQKTNWYSDSTQRENGFGKDILWVGKTSSVGWDGGKALFIKQVESRTAKVVAHGPVRTIIEMNSKGWENNGKQSDLISRFTLYSGHREFEHEVFCSENSIPLCTGLMKKENSEYYHNNGIEGLWGYNIAETGDLVADTFGLGIVVPEKYIVETTEDDLNNLYILDTKNFRHLKWYGVAVWEQEEKGFKKGQEFYEWLEKLKTRIDNPIKVTIH